MELYLALTNTQVKMEPCALLRTQRGTQVALDMKMVLLVQCKIRGAQPSA